MKKSNEKKEVVLGKTAKKLDREYHAILLRAKTNRR